MDGKLPKVLKHMLRYGADGTLIAPHWASAPWWPLLFQAKGKFKKQIYAFLIIPPCIDMFIPAVPGLTMFSSEKPSFSFMALRLCFYGAAIFSSITYFVHTTQVRSVLTLQFSKSEGAFCLLYFPRWQNFAWKVQGPP